MRLYLFAALFILLNACNNNIPEKKITQDNTDTVQERPSFIPVTAYIKGQIFEIKQKGLAPKKYTTINNHTDSVLLKLETLGEILSAYLHPEIDSVNLVSFFTETKFLDQSIEAFTFTYDPKPGISDSIPLLHWDVYVEPETHKVKRVYMVKKIEGNKTLQLTWQSNQWCKTTTIINNADGTSAVEKEEKISWDY
ncbi:hypothetical protein [Ferruginibacter sp.]|nr:hypothetical protein [Ferruginibacter sp.]